MPNRATRKKTGISKLPLITYDIVFDVATKKTGYAIFKNGKYEKSGVIDTSFNKRVFASYGDRLIQSSAEINYKLTGILFPLWKQLAFDTKGKKKKYNVKVNIGCEVSSHGSKQVLQKLSYYVGIYMSLTINQLVLVIPSARANGKVFSAREWQLRTLGFESDTRRDDGKRISIEKANQHTQGIKSIISDDEADAINMCAILNNLRDTQLVKLEKGNRSKRLSQLRKQLPRHEAIVKKYETIAHQKYIGTPIEKRKESSLEHLTKAQYKVYTTNKVKAFDIKQEIRTHTNTIIKEKK